MARIYGLNGLIRGRQGNNVFSIMNGTQVLKVYNPSVANPRTEAQQLQRSKFALAGKLSSATPHEAIVGMGGLNKRTRRGDFVSKIVRASSASFTAGAYNAQIAFADLQFSVGNVARYSTPLSFTASYLTTKEVQVQIPHMGLVNATPAGYGELVVVGLFDGAGSPLDNIRVVVHDLTSTTTILFRENAQINCVVAAWVVPYIATSRDTGLSAGNLGLMGDNDGVTLSTNVLSLASNAVFGNSNFDNLVLLQGANQNLVPAEVDDQRVTSKKK